MISAMFQISSFTSLLWRGWPLTCSVTAPLFSGPVFDAGTMGPMGALWSKDLPISQGRPCFFMSLCRSRRVMSRPTA